MQSLHVFTIKSRLPKKLEALLEIAYNLLFAWNDSLGALFAQIDQRLWTESHHNPIYFLHHVSQDILHSLENDNTFLHRLHKAHNDLSQYMDKKPTALVDFCHDEAEPQDNVPCLQGSPTSRQHIAYFSLEYGLAPSLPIYSGGLGILAGDHLKSASDLNLPLTALGLAYNQGYFHQYLTQDGWQQEHYPVHDFTQMPMRLARTPKDHEARICIALGDGELHARIWHVQVGRIALYLLDTDIMENTPELRTITARLYGGGTEMRLWQEILIGIGGMAALRTLGLEPKIIHMNEGHSAFAGLERTRLLMHEQGLSFEAAMECVAASSIFTTHTPVPAGNDRFDYALMERYFSQYSKDLGISFTSFMGLGREVPHNEREPFCMTVLALRFSHFSNGVSHLHGHVSRSMWKQIWENTKATLFTENQLSQSPLSQQQAGEIHVDDVPIGAITNGVHAPTWVADEIQVLYDHYLGTNWREDPDCTRAWSLVDTISDAELWCTHERLRARLVAFVRKRLQKQLKAQGARPQELQEAEEVLNPNALTIGFARRFATYKRAHLLLQDHKRLLALMAQSERPIQFIFAGKAHPQDQAGKQLIKDLVAFCHQNETRFSMVFLEDYDMEIASHLVAGCDVWLNTPRRPLEACGTSGMKAMLNGVIQCSTLDGWWDEAYLPDNSLGFAIGKGEAYQDEAYQDFVEAQTLYTILEKHIIPDFYERSHSDIPHLWVQRMKAALTALAPRFNANRMVLDYLHKAYIPALQAHSNLSAQNFASSHKS